MSGSNGKGKSKATPKFKRDPKNARKHGERNKAFIRQSLEEVGGGRSILVDGDGIVRAGNGVSEQAEALGFKIRPIKAKRNEIIAVVREDLRGAAAVRAALLDNRASDLSEWDAATLREIEERDHAALAGMFERDEWRDIMARDAPEAGTADAEPQIDRAEELNKKWQVKTGDLWRIGQHRLLCGDSLLIENVRRVLGDDRPSLIVADPPYGLNIVAADGYVGGGEKYDIPFGGMKRKGYVGGENRIKAKTGHYPIESWKGKKRLGSAHAAKPFGSQKSVRGSYGAAHVVDVGKYSEIIGDDTTQTAIQSSSLLLSEYGDAVHVWFGANYYADSLIPSQCWIVWDKETTGNFADCELAWTNQDRAAKLFRHRWNGMLRDSERERRWHPTQKPAALAAWIFLEFSEQDAIVLDPFCGAGWSMIGAENSKRRARVIEIGPAYCAVTLERMATAFPGIEIERLNGKSKAHQQAPNGNGKTKARTARAR